MIIAGKYEVLGKLGQGGQGSVYKVRHLGLDEVRALKVQPDHGIGEETVARFRREGRALARLKHAHIVQVFDLGRDADQYYLEMEYVDGPNLAQYLKTHGRPPVLDALEIGRQVADALTYAHAQPYVDSAGVRHTGMVHRDIKPSNILLRDQTPMYALLADFGLVKLGDPGERTTTGTMLGTYKYSAPEQLGLKRGRERVTVDFRADVFAFGLVLYELLEGRQFHAGLEPQEILARVLFEPDALEPEFTVAVLPSLRALVRRMVQRDPENRPANMKVVLAALDEALSDLRGGDATTVVVTARGQEAGEPRTEEELEEQIRALVAERERRRAQAARDDAQAARARALNAGAVELATPAFEAAVRREEEASFALSAGDLSQARELYELTSRLFSEAEAEAEVTRERRAAEEARDAARAAREAARALGAPDLATGMWAGAEESEQAAAALLASDDLSGARRAFDGVVIAFQAARSAAESERERRRAEAAAAAAAASGARAEAEAAGAPDHAAALWRRGCDAVVEGERHHVDGEDLEAAAAFRDAALAFADAARASADVQARVAADAAAQASEAAATAGAPELAPDELAAARAKHDAAAALLARGDAATARRLFTDVAQALDAVAALAQRRRAEEEARRRAAEERARQLADIEVARGNATAAAERARAAGAEELAAAQLAAAVSHEEAATAALGRDALAEAAARFTDAAGAFELAERSAVHEAGRRRALEARERAAQARAAAADAAAADWAPELAANAERLWEANEDAVAREAFADAERGFVQAAEAFERATAVARERAEEARRREAEARRRREEEEARRAEEEARRRAEEEARRRAAEERARQLAQVEAARASAAAAAARARDAGAADLAAVTMAAASARLADAEAAVDHETLLEAAGLFEAAAAAFDDAAHEATIKAARRRALGARETATRARAGADDAEAARWAGGLLASAEEHWNRADAALGREAFDDARAAFDAATTGFENAATTARAAAEEDRRQAERRRVAEERARQLATMEAARRSASAAAARARDAGAGDLAGAALGVAAARLAEAEAAAEREALGEAAELFAAADAAFAEATRASMVEAARRRAAAARDAAGAMRERALEAEAARWAPGVWGDAEARWAAADMALAGEAFQSAAEGFADAATVFERAAGAAMEAAEAERRRLEAEAERRSLEEEARRRAEAEAKRAAEEEAQRRAAEEMRRRAEAEAKRQAEEEARRRAEAEAKRQAEEEARRRAEAEAKRQAEEEARRLAEVEAKRRTQEEARRRAEAEARQAEERRRAEKEAAERACLIAAVEEARTAAADAATRAHAAAAADLASEALAAATARHGDAEAAAQREAFGDATALFGAARAAYEEAARAAVDEAERRRREEEERVARAEAERRAKETEAAEAERADAEATAVLPAASREASEEATVVAPPATVAVPADEVTVVAPPASTVPAAGEAPVMPAPPAVVRRGPLWWPYAAAALIALAIVYAVLRPAPEQIASRRERTPETTPATQPPATTPPPTLPSLAWGAISPAADATPAVKEGERLRFEAAVTQPDAQPHLDVTWLLDGKEVGHGASWEFAPGFTDGGRTYTVQVVAASEGRRLEQTWPVKVVNVDRPPVITSVSPKEGTVTVPAGAEQRFALEAEDPDEGDRLTYTWERNGKQVASGARPELTLRDAADGDEVRATVTDADGASAESRSWKVALKTPPPEPQPPRIVGQTPSPKRPLTVEEGGSIDFGLKVTDPDPNEKLAYAWFVDGRPVGTGKTLHYEAPTLEERKGAQKVEAEVTDAAGLQSKRVGWDVDVVWAPPEVLRLEPKGRTLSLESGETRELRAGATSATKGPLTYEWRVDGKTQAPTPNGRFELPSDLPAGRHTVDVASIDPRGLRSDRMSWRVDVRAAPPPTIATTPQTTLPPATVVSRLPPTTIREPPASGTLTEADVDSWLARYRNAWERKDAAALAALGVASMQELRDIVDKVKYIRSVEVEKKSASFAGAGATVSFLRRDTASTGQTLDHPLKTCRLERVRGQVVARGGCL